jgi:natural product biosynthesis luciferase-like monooxygenase protein
MNHQARLLNVWDALTVGPRSSFESMDDCFTVDRSKGDSHFAARSDPRGARAVSQEGPTRNDLERRPRGSEEKSREPVQFSLFYFDGKERALAHDKYRLLVEGAKFADEHGFTAVWTPERHFHEFGGLYPNPAVTSAALAMITNQIQIRAGSVVVPLHHDLRVAEEWAAVDNLSHGRIGISFASGWHADDFALAPQNYLARKTEMKSSIETIRRLWRGDSVATANGLGKMVELRTFPKPIQRELPIWVTCSGNPETFVLAGEVGSGVLTHLLGQSVEELQEKITLYRDALARCGHDATKGTVTLMLHTFIGEDLEEVREKVRQPFCEYLLSAISLIQRQLESSNSNGADGSPNPWRKATSLRSDQSPAVLRTAELTDGEKNELAAYGFDRYFNTAALFGTRETCLDLVSRLAEIGVDEIACLIDFGVDVEAALGSLRHLSALKDIHRQQVLTEQITQSHHPKDGQQVDLDYWIDQLKGTVSVESTILASEPLRFMEYGISQSFTMPAELNSRVDQFSGREGVTNFILLLTAFQVLLRRYEACDDISVGACLSISAPTQSTDCDVVNTLVLRATVTDEICFRDLLRRACHTAADALGHHRAPFRKLSECLGVGAASHRLFSHAFLFLRDTPQSTEDPAWFVDILKRNTGCNDYKSILAMWRDDKKLRGVFCGNAREYEAETTNRMPVHFQTLLEDIAGEPQRPISELAIITREESARLSNDFNAAL